MVSKTRSHLGGMKYSLYAIQVAVRQPTSSWPLRQELGTWDIQSPGFPICGFHNDFQTLGHLTKVFSSGGIALWRWGSYGRLPS